MGQEQTARREAVKYCAQGAFRRTLCARVAAYFDENGLNRRDQRAMYVKTAVLLMWAAASYGLLVFGALSMPIAVIAAISLGLANAGIGFGVMHDAGHRAYSRSPLVNRLLFHTLDVLGGSSYLWSVKHNRLHHTYANIAGFDADIDIGALGRLSPAQRRRPFHRFQHLYAWALYGLILVKWHFIDDFAALVTGQMAEQRFARPRGADAVKLVLGKVIFFALAFVLPAQFHPLRWVIAGYLLVTVVEGLTLAVVFQLAHCVLGAEFPVIMGNRLEHDWATHQLLTTADFAPRNVLLSWYIGGLNYQIEHHLFPGISHVHYPALSKIVARTCREFGLPYHVAPTFRSAVRSHYLHLRALGRA